MPDPLMHEDPHRGPDVHLPGGLLAHRILHVEGPETIDPVAAAPRSLHSYEVPSDIGERLPNSSIGIHPSGEADSVDPLPCRRLRTHARSSRLLKDREPRRAHLAHDRMANHRGGLSEPSG